MGGITRRADLAMLMALEVMVMVQAINRIRLDKAGRRAGVGMHGGDQNSILAKQFWRLRE